MRPAVREELDLDAIGPFHVRWYPNRTAGPFHGRADLAEYIQAHGLDRPAELLMPFEAQDVEAVA